MTSLITETCLSLRPIGLSTAPGQAFCPSSGLLVFWSSAATESAASTATRSVPSMAGRAFADGSMMYRCDGWGLNICARLRGGSPARSAVLAQLMAAIGQGGQKRVARSKRVVAAGEGFVVCDVRCHAPRPAWSPPEVAQGYVLVFVRAGSFRRRVNGRERFMD